jgi:hypothetical protein
VGNRYFSATAQGQRLYIDGLSERGEWDPGQLVFYLNPASSEQV